MNTVKHVSIVIVNYNAQKDTEECLHSLAKMEVKSCRFSVVVVDNGSLSDFEVPKKLDLDIELVRSQSNLGFTGGNNLGIHTAIETYNSDFVMLLNNDTVVSDTLLDTLLEQLEADPHMGMIAPKIYFSKGQEFHQSYTKADLGTVLWYAGGSIDWIHLAAFHRGVDEIDRNQFALQDESDFATGCCVLIKREVLEKIGFLDKRYFLYLEDVDLSLRAHYEGYSIGYTDATHLWHKNAGSSDGSGSRLHQYYQTRNRLLFFFLHGTTKTRIRVFLLAARLLLSGTQIERKGVLHFLLLQYGKQPLI